MIILKIEVFVVLFNIRGVFFAIQFQVADHYDEYRVKN